MVINVQDALTLFFQLSHLLMDILDNSPINRLLEIETKIRQMRVLTFEYLNKAV